MGFNLNIPAKSFVVNNFCILWPTLVRAIKAREVNLISSEERVDTTSVAGELAFHVLGAIAKFERRLISLRTKTGPVPVRKHGRSLGRPPLQP